MQILCISLITSNTSVRVRVLLLCFLCWHRVDVPLLYPACAGGSLRLHTEPTGQNKAPVTVPPRFAILCAHLSFQYCTLNEGLLSLHDLKASLLIRCFSSPRINHTQGWGFGGKGHVKTCGVALCMNNSSREICVIRREGLKYSQSWCEFSAGFPKKGVNPGQYLLFWFNGLYTESILKPV